MRVYSIEGAVGAGKSEFLTHLSRVVEHNDATAASVCVVTEPVEEWMEVVAGMDMSPLDAQYRYPTMYGALFQVYVYTSHLNNIRRCVRRHRNHFGRLPDLVFVERFPGYSNLIVFMSALQDGGFVDDTSARMLMQTINAADNAELYRQALMTTEAIHLDFIYIVSDINQSIERAQLRDREEVDVQKLRDVHRCYELWLGRGRQEWVDDMTGTTYDIRTVHNVADLAALGQEVESMLNAELARTRLHTDMLRHLDEDANNM
jgi:deoxyadenosine/deoxycytidine kinase